MCGIIGYTDANTTALHKAHALQCHRGPDDAGFYNDNHISLGHNRLSIIDLNPRSAQPLWSSDKKIAIVFNGEIYNYQQLKESLKLEYDFQTESDTEVLLALYKKYGQKLTEHLHGMYAFAIYDTERNEVVLFRDEFGIKPLYYAYIDGKLFFTSELKAMISLFGSYKIPLVLDRESISVYLTLGYTISPRTIYKDIQLILPGTGLRYSLNNSTVPEFFTTPLPEPKNLNESEYIELIEKKILSNLVADVPVGVFFSGGTDSSLIAAVLHKHGIDLETFSVKVEGRDADEYYFKRIADELQLKNTTYTFDTEAFDSIYEEVVNKLDNPSGSNGIFQTYFIAKKAAKKVKVVLMGDGGDELFLGYHRSFPLFKMATADLKKGIWLEKIYFLLPHFYAKNYLFLKISEALRYPISYYLNQMSVARNDSTFQGWQTCRRMIVARNIPPQDFDVRIYLNDNLLFKSDLATSFCSIEGRVPLLDNEILTETYPYAQESVNKNTHKYFLKKMLSQYLPNELVYREKSGFGINYKKIFHESKYLKNDYKEAVEYLTNNDILPLFESSKIDSNPQVIFTLIALHKSILNNKLYYN